MKWCQTALHLVLWLHLEPCCGKLLLLATILANLLRRSKTAVRANDGCIFSTNETRRVIQILHIHRPRSRAQCQSRTTFSKVLLFLLLVQHLNGNIFLVLTDERQSLCHFLVEEMNELRLGALELAWLDRLRL